MSNFTYSIITPIKESNKGKVYLAKLEDYDFPVIVKELKHGNQAVFQALSELDSEYIPKIYKIESSADGLVIAEEYIEGEILSDYLALGKLTEAEWLDVAKQLCEALRSLHEHVPPIIHRDIKPSNIILNSKGRVKIIDFDSSRLYKAESEGDTRLLGTERYAPPEQYGFSQTDCRSDIYSLGVVFGMFPAFSSKARQKRWRQMVEKCTLFAPESRFQTVGEVGKEVNKIARIRRIQLWRIGGAIAGTVLLLLVAGILWRPGTPVSPVTGDEIPTPTSAAGEELTPTTAPAAEDEVPTPTVAQVTEDEVPTPTVAQVTEDEAPTPTVAPVTEDKVSNPTLAPEIEEANRTTPPAWRDIENDIPAYIALKEQIRNNHLTVEHCFKDRLSESGFLLQVKWLEQQQIEFRGVELYSHRDDTQVKIEETYYEVSGSIISIGKEYMQTLEDGYYTIVVSMHNTENDHDINHSAVLYVAEHDAWENREAWLQNTTMSFYGAEGETLHNVVMNESSNEIVSLLHQDRTPVDSSLYRVTHGGRGIEFSNELLSQYGDREFVEFYVMGMDGTDTKVRIENYIQDNLQ